MNDIFESHQIILSNNQKESLEKLFHLFVQWNEKINLSAIRTKDDVYLKHFVDSLLITKHADLSHQKILDLGAGGGFPCLPLAIAFPTCQIYALDSVGKKMKAVQSMADTLKLPIKTLHGRIEEYGHNRNFREKFDIVTARALAPWPTLLEYALPFLKVGGTFIAYQGPAIREDLTNFKGLEELFGCQQEQIIEEKLNDDQERIFIFIKKEKPTLTKYPREVGIPKNSPLDGRGSPTRTDDLSVPNAAL